MAGGLPRGGVFVKLQPQVLHDSVADGEPFPV